MSAVRFVTFVLFLTLPGLGAGAASAQSESEKAIGVINSFVETGIEDVLNADVDPQTRLQRWNDLFVTFFDIPTISRFVVGRHWRRASDDEQARFIETFQKYIVYTWYRRFDEYNGQTLRISNTSEDGDTGFLVESFIQQPGSPTEFAVNWRMRQRGDTYQIVDVIVEGVSMALTYRSEYAAVIKRSGNEVTGLIDELSTEVASLSEQFGPIKDA